MDISLEGKVALVTGASKNIGGGIALMLGKYGARVVCHDIKPEIAEGTMQRLQRNGCEAISVVGDVSNEDDVKRYVQEVIDRWGKIDILVNCAGILGGKGVLDFDLESFNRQLIVNCAGHFLNTKYVAKTMIDRGIKGSIICIISTAGWQGQAGNIGYCTSKGGIIQFTRAAAMDLAPYGIRVNSFTPTATTPDNPELVAARRAAGQTGSPFGANYDFGGMVPMGEQPTPTDYGHVIAFLCSDYSRLITGTDFRVDGGALAKYWPYKPPEGGAGPLPLVSMDVSEA
jgi:NAD(P)-dependent dehydrogenase (short-subunit alcohol dehydrogenase family)